MQFIKYQGAGNDFLIADNRLGRLSLTPAQVAALCDRRYGVGADGLMLLELAEAPYRFRMVYYNSDGSGGMMCGNGGRCIVAFAARLGLDVDLFLAPDGPHEARVIATDGLTDTVRLRMRDVEGVTRYDADGLHGLFIDTGTRHFVTEVSGIDAVDVDRVGREIRHRREFAPQGVNVNFVEPRGDKLWVRTFEKGVEAETYACGTGITAAAICSRAGAIAGRYHVEVRALRDDLSVDFTLTPGEPLRATDVWLTGPATYVAAISIPS